MARVKPPLVACPALKKTGQVCGMSTVNAPGADGRLAARWNLCAWHSQLAAIELGAVQLAPGFTLVYEEPKA